MKLICGLGNPGIKYERTRHNMGFIILDMYLGEVPWKKLNNGLYYKTKINGEDVIFLKPQTYMNLSGQAVKYYIDYYKIPTDEVLIIHDDLDLPLGETKIKYTSGDGGHNGIKSIIESLKTNSFLRLKIGISKPEQDIIDFVIGNFKNPEFKQLESNKEKYINIINDFIDNTSKEKLMNKYN